VSDELVTVTREEAIELSTGEVITADVHVDCCPYCTVAAEQHTFVEGESMFLEIKGHVHQVFYMGDKDGAQTFSCRCVSREFALRELHNAALRVN